MHLFENNYDVQDKINQLEDIIYKIKRILVGLFFSFGGILFLIFGIWDCISVSNYKKNGVEITAEITDLRYGSENDDKDIFVSYEVAGTRYEDVQYYVTDDEAKVGDLVQIYYDKQDPSKIKPVSNGHIIHVVIGAFLLIVGLVSMFKKPKMTTVVSYDTYDETIAGDSFESYDSFDSFGSDNF